MLYLWEKPLEELDKIDGSVCFMKGPSHVHSFADFLANLHRLNSSLNPQTTQNKDCSKLAPDHTVQNFDCLFCIMTPPY